MAARPAGVGAAALATQGQPVLGRSVVRLRREVLEARGHDPHHRVVRSREGDRATDHGRVGPEASLPEAVAEHDDAFGVLVVLLLPEAPPQRGLHADEIEVAPGDAHAGQGLGPPRPVRVAPELRMIDATVAAMPIASVAVAARVKSGRRRSVRADV